MKKLLIRAGRSVLIVFGVVLLLGAFGAARGAPLDDAAAWREACKLSGYSCVWLKPPLVARAPLGMLYGRYRMDDTYILVNENIDGNLAYAVKVHEMVHYLQWKRGAWTSTHENKCRMEHDAFDVSNKVLRRLKEYARVVDWDKARLFYGCQA